jgi:hypothetical protein
MPDAIVFNWRQPVTAFTETSLLLNTSEVAAVIRREDIGTTIETAYNKWLLKQVGIVRSTIPVKNIHTGVTEALYKAGWRRGGGTIQFILQKTNFTWRTTDSKSYDWLSQENEIWGRFHLEFSKKGKLGLLETTQENLDRDEFELLMVLGWYLCINQLGYGGAGFERLPDGISR